MKKVSRFSLSAALPLTLFTLFACGSSPAPSDFPNGDDSGASSAGDSGSGFNSSDGSLDASGCNAPDLLVVLDRTDSMTRTPDGKKPDDTPAGRASSKWGLAVAAIDAMVAPPRDTTVRFGLELFPQNPDLDGGDSQCRTLPEQLEGHGATNPTCQQGQVVVPPGNATSAAIEGAIDQDTTPLCVSTPIGSALGTATTALQTASSDGRTQFVVLVTDGGETCSSDPLSKVQALAAHGIKTFVIGFGQDGDSGDSGVNVSLLNDLACAGETAVGFPGACESGDGGYVANAGSSPVFFAAQDGTSLASALDQISQQVCCACGPR